MVGRGGSGVRPGMLRGGKDEKDGTEWKNKGREGGRESERERAVLLFLEPRAKPVPSGL